MMTAEHLHLPPVIPEWRRSGRFLLLALALHVAILFYPCQIIARAPRELPPPAAITLQLAAPQALTTAAPTPVPTTPVPPSPHRPRATPTPRPVLAMAPAAIAQPTPFSVAPPSPAPAPAPVSTPPSASPPAAAVASISAARFDAAYLHNPAPTYPALSRRLGEEGKVLLKVRVSPAGQAVAVDIEKSSNFQRLDEIARQTVANWRFVPAKRGEEAIEASVIVPITFRLDN